MDYYDWKVWLPIWGSPDATMADGSLVWYDHPERTDINEHMLKLGLQKSRYHGQFIYSILSHVVLVAEILRPYSPRMAALGGLHDAHEAIVGDQNPRQKTDAFRKVEDNWSDHIHNAYGVSPARGWEKVFIKHADRAALIAEMEVIGHPAFEWPEELWNAHGGRPRAPENATALAMICRNADPDELWTSLMNTIREGGDREVARSDSKLVAGGLAEQPGVRAVATEKLVRRDKRFVI